MENVECEREVEFRSYEILLNLNEGDTLREVQTLEENVRNHPRYSKQSIFKSFFPEYFLLANIWSFWCFFHSIK